MRPRKSPLFVLLSTLLAAGTAVLAAQSTLSDFGVSEAELKSQLADILVNGRIPFYPNKKVYQAASPALRAAFVKNALGWVKAYTESSAFKADYNFHRDQAKPAPPVSKGTPDAQFAKYLSDQRQSLEEMKKNVAKMTPDMQKQMADAVKQMEEGIQRTSSDPQISAMMKQGFANEAESDKKDYQERLAKHEQEFPADPRVAIASRLRQFLELSKDIPFDAKLVPAGGGKMKFADARYEAKSDDWKLCYRAGKEPVEAARAFAADWLRQIEK